MNSIHVNFYKLPNKIYELGLSANELLVLAYLLSLANNETIHPSKTTISSRTGLGKRTIDRTINSLVKKGFLEYNRGYSKGELKVCNQYRIRVDKIDPTCIVKSDKQYMNETQNALECDEMIKKSIEKYGS